MLARSRMKGTATQKSLKEHALQASIPPHITAAANSDTPLLRPSPVTTGIPSMPLTATLLPPANPLTPMPLTSRSFPLLNHSSNYTTFTLQINELK